MNVPQTRMDKVAFLDWAENQEGRCELVGGRVVMMMRPVLAHGLIVTNLLAAICQRIDRAKWHVLSDFGLDTAPSTIRAPDIVVVPVGCNLNSRTTSSAVFVAEVLSPASATIDLGDKVAEYVGLPELAAYLVLTQDEPKVWLRSRNETGFPATPEVITGLEATIAIAPLGLDLPMAEIYAGAI